MTEKLYTADFAQISEEYDRYKERAEYLKKLTKILLNVSIRLSRGLLSVLKQMSVTRILPGINASL